VIAGTGTLLNVTTILVGTAAGAALGDRLPRRTREVVTDGLGLVTLLLGGLNAVAVHDAALRADVGGSAPVLIVLGAVLLGGVAGSLLDLEGRLARAGEQLRRTLRRLAGSADPSRERFVEGFVTASLVYCIGPLAILGALDDGLGRGISSLAVKSSLDGVASVAFAASLGWGVACAALPVLVLQGGVTLLGATLGDVVPDSDVSAMTATGGLLLVGVALRLLRVRDVPVADLLPALVVAPVLVQVVAALR
jgi:uncharacterized membrane protein YqgA involved in biofilm formation